MLLRVWHSVFPKLHYYETVNYMDFVCYIEYEWKCRCGAVEKKTRDIYVFEPLKETDTGGINTSGIIKRDRET